jgi:hypothetical protein
MQRVTRVVGRTVAPAQFCLLLALSGCLEPGLDKAACWEHPQRAVQNAMAHNPQGAQIVLDQNAACLTQGCHSSTSIRSTTRTGTRGDEASVWGDNAGQRRACNLLGRPGTLMGDQAVIDEVVTRPIDRMWSRCSVAMPASCGAPCSR